MEYIYKDIKYRTLEVGHNVIRPVMDGNKPALQFSKVTKIDEHGVYLDGSYKVLRFPNRLYTLGK